MMAQYNLYFVTLSVVIAMIASVLALSITGKISYAMGRGRIFWLVSGSIVMGLGVWSMHFIGMMAFRLPVSVSYHVMITIMSMLASVVSSFIAFYITMPQKVKRYRIVIGGFIMGNGIATMHYLGMEAMQMDASFTYDLPLVGLSVFIAIVVSYVALFLFLRFRQPVISRKLKWLSGMLMGIAISGMHYTGMAAVNFETEGITEQSNATTVNHFLLVGVTVTIAVILIVSWGAMLFDRHVLRKMAYQDTTTPLQNRNAMRQFFSTYNRDQIIACLFLDLDQFKAINDTLGHHMGDRLLEDIGDVFYNMTNDDQFAFRIGGDEFLFLMKYGDEQKAMNLAERIIDRFRHPFFIERHEIHLTTSIGISIGTIDASNPTSLLEEADIAMYKAKELGRNQLAIYSSEMGTVEVRKMEIEQDLPLSMTRDQLFVEYQPKMDVKENRIIGVETLLRWEHPKFGVISPSEFIPIAEVSGVIAELTKWTLEEACSQCKQWQRQGIDLPVAVNLSVKLFQSINVSQFVHHILTKYQLDPKYLEVEVTESVIYSNQEAIYRQLHDIRTLGVRVSMDDFGTGYSSISLLDSLPIDTLKLDKSFVDHIEEENKQILIEGILFIADKLGLEVIAEGIETKRDEEIVKKLGCFVMQGYYYRQPVCAKELVEWIHQRRM
ncbi:diguanylate cyclase/phosphodiesterase with MHYT sensor [Gracilibacillus halophilus YIM-C55.5]|uniref:Diguanylate cyclase/phosphodiesterase with MHYT sensor n=1 Tax=Gracilibacillus halophilus YIM-C55.5 TaxID=1308866 RepID=N4WJB4_9BACI|nr:bifunctional diguanylate cyclase/phosphodiesterase [Gracilibacillus halophilus]ENH96247.1 diguanylate cyclase/phosphodiesterase with MHYT sensor [Gracilibacillus halophilus YIM-C55.5]